MGSHEYKRMTDEDWEWLWAHQDRLGKPRSQRVSSEANAGETMGSITDRREIASLTGQMAPTEVESLRAKNEGLQAALEHIIRLTEMPDLLWPLTNIRDCATEALK